MKSKMNIKSIVIMAAVGIISLFFINMSLAANTAKVNVETANLRETADEKAKILELLSKNDEVEVIEKTGEWYKVKVRNITGYLRQDLIIVSGEVAQENTTAQNQTVENKVEEQTTEQPEEPKQEAQEAQEVSAPAVENQETEQKEEIQEKEIELGKQKIGEDTKIKIVPVINARDIIEVKKDEEINVVEIVNGWACVETSEAKGWIRKEKIQKEEANPEQPEETKPEETKPEETTQAQETEKPKTVIKTLYISSASVNLRKEANTSSEILAKLTVNTSVDVLSEANGWSQVRVNGKEGYISSSLLSTKKQETSRSSETPRTANTDNTKKEETTQAAPPASATGSSVVDYAKQFIGTKYTYGGTSPSTGFDCSGFTSYVYKHFGVSLPRTSGGQSGAGKAVSRDNLAAGDLVIYSGHVAIYVGGGQVIHSPRPGKSVCIVPINQAASNYIGARRVL